MSEAVEDLGSVGEIDWDDEDGLMPLYTAHAILQEIGCDFHDDWALEMSHQLDVALSRGDDIGVKLVSDEVLKRGGKEV